MSGDWDVVLCRCLLGELIPWSSLQQGGALGWRVRHLRFFAYLTSWFEDNFVPSLLLALRVIEVVGAGCLAYRWYFRWWDV